MNSFLVSTIALMTADANAGAWCCAAAFLPDCVRKAPVAAPVEVWL
jgi:hypothetical protein